MNGNRNTPKTDAQRKRYARLSLMLLSLFLTYQVCLTAFGHGHSVNGSILVHSHPFSTQQHTHSEGQFHTLAQLSFFCGLEPAEQVELGAPLSYSATEEASTGAEKCPVCTAALVCLRAPPYISFLIV